MSRNMTDDELYEMTRGFFESSFTESFDDRSVKEKLDLIESQLDALQNVVTESKSNKRIRSMLVELRSLRNELRSQLI